MWSEFNPNPSNSRIGDCAVRAICKALGKSWERAYLELCVKGFGLLDLPNANHVWGAVLKDNGFRRCIPPKEEPCTVEDFCRDFPEGVFVLALSGHVVAVVDGSFFDTWNCGNEIVLYFWKKEGD